MRISLNDRDSATSQNGWEKKKFLHTVLFFLSIRVFWIENQGNSDSRREKAGRIHGEIAGTQYDGECQSHKILRKNSLVPISHQYQYFYLIDKNLPCRYNLAVFVFYEVNMQASTNFGISRSPCITNLNDMDEVVRAINLMKSLPQSSSDWKARVVFHSVSGEWFDAEITIKLDKEPKLFDIPLPHCCME